MDFETFSRGVGLGSLLTGWFMFVWVYMIAFFNESIVTIFTNRSGEQTLELWIMGITSPFILYFIYTSVREG